MNPNKTKALLCDGQSAIGTLLFMADPAVAEIAGRAGFDFCWIDTEHAATDLLTATNMVRAAELTGMTAMVRVSDNSEKLILRALETGAQGIVVPFLQNREQAERAASAVRYPPRGTRGTCTVARGAGYGSLRGVFGQHVDEADSQVLLVGLIEDEHGVANVDEILDAGVEVVQMGNADLSAAFGVPGQHHHPKVLEAVEHVVRAVRGRSDRWAGIATSPADAARWVDDCRFLTYSVDTVELLTSYRRGLEGIRKAVAAPDRAT
jgi:4-hydroxy-2-oxoheptanedioate aldolase